ncbi:MAG TPA: PmeII family type II restriction endonuclease [Nostoc sp.]|uniref:PmeII family type II restriction endonuclease n=1 Tax=Nostoc sp. TaxID=1180 RepID=UPI002D6C9087|nr:PmeII family type II restriction endonuclease [Nostoc sp.]HYX14902.1 PmeII family type II restriction endonuclease [Nostoc sp.]
MAEINLQELEQFIETDIIQPFYCSRLNSLQNQKLNKLLKTKNPYLFIAKNTNIAADYVKQMLDAFLSSSEETIFGGSLEKLAIFVNQKIYNGYKPPEGEFPSIDLIFDKDEFTYIVGVKSGGYWGNADSIRQMITNITLHHKSNIKLISGICYGTSGVNKCEVKDKNKKGIDIFYYKYVGKDFWSLISGIDEFYTDIIEPLGKAIKGKDIAFKAEYDKKLNELTHGLLNDYCHNNEIDWEKIVQFNSKPRQLRQPRQPRHTNASRKARSKTS